MAQRITPLHPTPGEPCNLEGTYLTAPLAPEEHQGLFVYANFVTSLDGRIAEHGADGVDAVPDDIANPRDWRLFQELAARADVLISSGRYFRDLEAGRAQDVLPVGTTGAFADLRAWRREQGLREQPDVAIISATLDFTVPALLRRQGRRILVLTGSDADVERRRAREAEGADVVVVSSGAGVRGADATRALAERGYRHAYSVTGPWVLQTLVADGCLDTLFLTTVPRLIGGRGYTSIFEGERLSPAADWRLRWLYHDPHAPGPGGQFFARYDRP